MRSDHSDPKKMLAFLNMDTVLLSEEGGEEENQPLINTLKKFGMRDVCLFTNVTTENILDLDDATERNRYANIKKLLEREGFIIHAVVTPIDPSYQYGKEPGAFWRETLEPRVTELQQVNVDQITEDEFIEDQITLLDSACQGIMMDLINHAIANDLSKDILESLDERIFIIKNKIQQLMKDESSDFDKTLHPSVEQSDDLKNLLAHSVDMLRFCSKKTLLPLLNKSTTQDHVLRAISNVIDITKLSWLFDLREDKKIKNKTKKRTASTVPNKTSSMYACVMHSSLVNSFDGYVYFDTHQASLDAIAMLHPKLNKAELVCVKVDPEFNDREVIYRDAIGAVMPSKAAEIAEITARESETKRLSAEADANAQGRMLLEKLKLESDQSKAEESARRHERQHEEELERKKSRTIQRLEVLAMVQPERFKLFERLKKAFSFNFNLLKDCVATNKGISVPFKICQCIMYMFIFQGAVLGEKPAKGVGKETQINSGGWWQRSDSSNTNTGSGSKSKKELPVKKH